MDNLLTVIIPMYNAEDTIKPCIYSILKASKHKIHIIVTDDCSTDTSYAVIKNIIAELSQESILLLQAKSNLGPGNARNMALDHVTTPYVTFCDADDTIPNDAYDLMLQNALKHNSDVVMGQVLRKIDNSSWFIFAGLKDTYKNDAYNLIQDKGLFYRNPSPCNKIFKSEIILKNSIRYKNYKMAEDLLFLMQLKQFIQKITMINEVVYLYKTITVKKSLINSFDLALTLAGLNAYKDASQYAQTVEDFTPVIMHSLNFLFFKSQHLLPQDKIVFYDAVHTFIVSKKQLIDTAAFISTFKISLEEYITLKSTEYVSKLEKLTNCESVKAVSPEPLKIPVPTSHSVFVPQKIVHFISVVNYFLTPWRKKKAYALSNSTNLDEAMIIALNYIAYNPTQSWPYFILGKCQFKKGICIEAQKNIQKAIDIAPHVSHYHEFKRRMQTT